MVTTLRVMSDLIEPHLRHLRAAGKARNTIDDRWKLLRRLDAELPLGIEEATVDELEDFLAQFDTNQTKATYYGHIVGFYRWALDREHLDWDPSAALKRPPVPAKAPRPISDAELADLLHRCAEPFRLWLILAAYLGLRAFEIATLRRENITEDTTTVLGKGGKEATLPTHPVVWEAVKDRPHGPLVSSRGRGVDGDYLTRWFGKYLRTQLGIHGIALHRARHWFATTALRNTGNLRVVQELLRHSSPKTTAVYTQITDGERRTAIATLPVFTHASP